MQDFQLWTVAEDLLQYRAPKHQLPSFVVDQLKNISSKLTQRQSEPLDLSSVSWQALKDLVERPDACAEIYNRIYIIIYNII